MNKVEKDINEQIDFDALCGTTHKSSEQEAYNKLFSSLNTPPDIIIPADFAEKTATKSHRIILIQSRLKSVCLYTGIICFSLLLSAGILFFLANDLFWGLTRHIEAIRLPIIFIVVTICLIQFFDKFLKKPGLISRPL